MTDRRAHAPARRAAVIALLSLGLVGAGACEAKPPPQELVGPRNLVPADPVGPLVVRKTVYVPIYSSLYVSDHSQPIDINAVLSLRNVSEHSPVVITRVDYFHSDGHLLRSMIDGPQRLGAMQTAEFVIPSVDRSGGSGANFIVEWGLPEPGPDLLVEALMHGRDGNAGVSFLTEGRVVADPGPAKAP